MVEYRDEEYIKQLQKEIAENEVNGINCLVFLCCIELKFFYSGERYEKKRSAVNRLRLELQKPKKPKSA